jgi:hypothetical protein
MASLLRTFAAALGVLSLFAPPTASASVVRFDYAGTYSWESGIFGEQPTPVSVRSGPSFPVESAALTIVSTTNGSGHYEAGEP